MEEGFGSIKKDMKEEAKKTEESVGQLAEDVKQINDQEALAS